MKYAKWLLKVIHFKKYVFKLKIESVPMCICPRFSQYIKVAGMFMMTLYVLSELSIPTENLRFSLPVCMFP